MGWWREIAKGFINLSVATVVVLIYGAMTNPQLQFFYAIVGAALVLFFAFISYRLWRKES